VANIALVEPRHGPVGPSEVPPMSPGETPMLARALVEGNAVFWALAQEHGPSSADLAHARDFLFKRWALEALLVLRIQGPTRFNDLALALGGPRGQSLSPKLASLVERGLATRSRAAGGPLRVVYELTPAGKRLADSVYTLTRWKAIQARATIDPESPVPAISALPKRPPSGSPQSGEALERYVEATASIASAREAICRPREFEDGLVTARHFCKAWVHKWHSQVLTELALGGPARFSELRARLGVGNEALTRALAGLNKANALEVQPGDGGKRYRVGPVGWADLSLSAPLALLFIEATRKRGPAGRRSTESD